MNDLQFLRYALKQSFIQPNFKNFNNVDFAFSRDLLGNGVFMPHNKYLSLSIVSAARIKKMIKDAYKDTRKSDLFLQEYLTFKHDFSENTSIPQDMSEIRQLCQLMDLPLINRQVAQKQRLMAVWSPLDFKADVVAAEKSFRQCLLKFKKQQKNSPEAWNIALMQNFVSEYRRQMQRFCGLNIWAIINKRLLKKYTIEAVSMLIEGRRLPSDFAESKLFKGHRTSERFCRALQQLILKITALSDNEALLILAQNFLLNRRLFAKEYRVLRNMLINPAELILITSMRTDLQKVFDAFVFLCYLDAVSTAFSDVYLEKCPVDRHQELLTVAPECEIKKVQKILQSAEKIDCRHTLCGKLFFKAKENYKTALNAFLPKGK